MKRFRKKTIALVLASVVTVVGAFGANNYKNSLTGLKFESGSTGNLNVVVQTKSLYDGNLTPIRKDANTYILTLPEFNSEASQPNLTEVSSLVSSVNIRTMPYSNTAKGYTRITIKTVNPTLKISTTNQVFLPEKISLDLENTASHNTNQMEPSSKYKKENEVIFKEDESINNQEEYHDVEEELDNSENAAENISNLTSKHDNLDSIALDRKEVVDEKYSTEHKSYLFLLALLIILIAAYFYSRAKTQILEIAGENVEINVDLAKNKKNQKKEDKSFKKIKNVINTLDSTYAKSAYTPSKSEYTVSTEKLQDEPEDLNIVDLDELFQEYQTKNSDADENQALEAFLSGFSFDDTNNIEIESTEESKLYDEDIYEQVINDDSIKFTEEDINCINELLEAEINNDTMRNIKDYAVSNPIKKEISKETTLEKLVLDYTVNQNIIFTQDDIKILNKLLNVELDDDFITNLRTNSQRLSEMEADISEADRVEKKAEPLILEVSDMLPDLSKALSMQKGRTIEFERKPEVFYAEEGYEVKTLSIEEELPNLSIEINNKDAYLSKPSEKYEIMDENYIVGNGEIKVSASLPNLKDALKNPEKYEKEDVVAVADAEALLASITNVTFKPFDDGSNNFEILNDFPTISDIQNEFKGYTDFEISSSEDFEISDEKLENYDNSNIFANDNYIDLDDKQKAEYKGVNASESAEELIKKIELAKKERAIKRAEIAKLTIKEKEIEKKKEKTLGLKSEVKLVKCIYEGKAYEILSSVSFGENKGCYLAKNDNKYTILAYIGENLKKIQEYENLKSEKIQAKINERFDDKTVYLLRIGLQKLIVNVFDDDIKFVMNLC